MSKVWYKLEDIEDFEHTGSHYFDASYAPSLVENAQNVELWDTDDFKDIFDMQCEKSILLKETADPWGAFLNKYNQWIARNGVLIANEAYTLFMKYNPIHNYDRHEEYTGSDTVTKTPTNWQETKTETPNNWKETTTQTPTGWIKTDERSYTNYHETETETPTNWEKSTTQTPTNWEKTTTQTPTAWTTTDTDTYTNYTETDTQTPTGWKKETKSTDFLNPSIDVNKVVPFDSDTLTAVSATQKMINETEEQKGTMQDQKTITGSKQHTSAQSGTYQSTEAQAGTYVTAEEQTGTYERDTTKTGKETLTQQQAGTYTTERAESGSRSTTTSQTGTFEDETEYGKVVDIYGNIGTLTTGAMIKETVELYDTDFVARWLNRFFSTYCAYV